MEQRRCIFCPFYVFFVKGRYWLGLGVLLLQVSLIFWPMAARIARRHVEAQSVQRVLNELSDAYKVPRDQNPFAKKRFGRAKQPA